MSHGLLAIFGLLAGIAIPLASFAAGLRTMDPLWLFSRPRLLGRSLVAILIVVPVLAAILVELLSPGNVYVRAGVMVSILAIGIGPPDIMKRTHAEASSVHYEIGLDVVLLPVAIVFMPLATAVHGAVFGHDLRLSPWEVAKVVLLQVLLPFAAGYAVAKLLPKAVEHIGRYAELFVTVAFAIVDISALIVAWRPLIGLGRAAWLTCAAIALAAILVGHVTGGPTREGKGVLAAYSAIRFPGLALLLVSVTGRRQRLIPVVVAYVITSVVMVGVYRAVMARRRKAKRAEARA